MTAALDALVAWWEPGLAEGQALLTRSPNFLPGFTPTPPTHIPHVSCQREALLFCSPDQGAADLKP